MALKNKICSREQKGVAIILSPDFYNYYKLSGAKPLIIPDNENNEEFGRFIGIHLSLHVKTNNKGAYSKKKKSNKSQKIDLFISSAYHPVDFKDQTFSTIISLRFTTQFLLHT